MVLRLVMAAAVVAMLYCKEWWGNQHRKPCQILADLHHVLVSSKVWWDLHGAQLEDRTM